MEKKTHALFAGMVVFALMGVIFAGIAFHKIFVYENSEYSWEENKNAYVGGDAYNYIINGTYFAGYSALSGAMFVCACVCATQVARIKNHEELLKVQREIDSILKIGFAEKIEEERAKKAADEKRQNEQRIAQEKERRAEEVAKQARIAAYWDCHPEEKRALEEKQAAAQEGLQKLGGFAREQREVLETLIRNIDNEFTKDRED